MKTRVMALLLVLFLVSNVNSYHWQVSKPTSRTIDQIQKLHPNLDTEIAAIHAKYIDQSAHRWGLKTETVVSVAFEESRFNSAAVSSKGAIGPMQVLPYAHKDKLKKRRIQRSELYSLRHNYDIGCEILKDYITRGGSLDKGLRLYVGGNCPKYVSSIKKNIRVCHQI
jgi:soluble lytic murein transglycosylase-like protein